jgi:hypothetical protein
MSQRPALRIVPELNRAIAGNSMPLGVTRYHRVFQIFQRSKINDLGASGISTAECNNAIRHRKQIKLLRGVRQAASLAMTLCRAFALARAMLVEVRGIAATSHISPDLASS